MTGPDTYPVRVSADIDRPPSRWLRLVKWILVIPHFIGIFRLDMGGHEPVGVAHATPA